FFHSMSKSEDKPRIPDFTTDLRRALDWAAKGQEVLARTKLQGHSGMGIVFFSDDPDEFSKARLFVLYKKKIAEFRIHYAFGKMIDFQQKALRTEDDSGNRIDPSTIDFRIRNHSNGFIFKREN